MCLFQFWFPQGICLGVGLLGKMVVLFLVFKVISILSSLAAVSIYIGNKTARAFHFLAIVNSAAVNNGMHVSISILVSSGYMLRSGIAGSYGGFILSFFKDSPYHLP